MNAITGKVASLKGSGTPLLVTIPTEQSTSICLLNMRNTAREGRLKASCGKRRQTQQLTAQENKLSTGGLSVEV